MCYPWWLSGVPLSRAARQAGDEVLSVLPGLQALPVNLTPQQPESVGQAESGVGLAWLSLVGEEVAHPQHTAFPRRSLSRALAQLGSREGWGSSRQASGCSLS